MRRVIWILLIAILVLLIVCVATFVYLSMAESSYGQQVLVNPGINASNPVIGVEHVNYVLNAIGAWKLHNPPFSSEKPLIEVNISDDIFSSEIGSGVMTTVHQRTADPDIIIVTSKDEVVKAFLSSSPSEFMKESVSSGNTVIEMKAGYVKLFSKGYLGLYKDLTGKSLS